MIKTMAAIGILIATACAARFSSAAEQVINDLEGLSLSVSPDGRYMSYIRRERGSRLSGKPRTLSVRNLVSGETVDVVSTDFAASLPSWSEDSRYLAYYSLHESGRSELNLWNAVSGKAVPLANRPSCGTTCIPAQWMSGGRWLLLYSNAEDDARGARGVASDPPYVVLDNELTGARPAANGITVLKSPPLLRSGNSSEPAERDRLLIQGHYDVGQIVLFEWATGRQQVLASRAIFRNLLLHPDGRSAIVAVDDPQLARETAEYHVNFYRLDLPETSLDSRPADKRNADGAAPGVPVDANNAPLPLVAGPAKMHFASQSSISPSGRYLAYTETTFSSSTGDLFLVDLRDGVTRNLTEAVEFAQDAAVARNNPLIKDLATHDGKFGGPIEPVWLDDESAVLALHYVPLPSTEIPARFELWRIPLDGKSPQRLSPEGISVLSYATCGNTAQPCRMGSAKELVIKARDHGRNRVAYMTLNPVSGKIRVLQELDFTPSLGPPEVDAHSLTAHFTGSQRGQIVVSADESPRAPPEVWLHRIKGGSSVRLSVLNPRLNGKHFGTVERIPWTAADGRKLGALLQMPAKLAVGERPPLIVYLYFNGAGAREAYGKFNGGDELWTALTTRRYAVLVPEIPHATNPQTACHDITASVNAAVDAAAASGKIDAKRIGLFGYSFGAYIVSCVVTETDRYRAAVAGAGPADLTQYCLSHPYPCFLQPMAISGGLWERPQDYIAASPIYRLNRVATPMLLHFGKKDVRARKDMLEMFYGLAKLDKPVELVAYDGLDHGTILSHPDYWPRIFNWYDTYLYGEGPPLYESAPAVSSSSAQN
jgi:dipeptidyl aminopeptidase/acylaminoacyl peptidase